MNVFEAVKQSVTTRQAAEHYGILVGRNGMCVCPFHDDKNPSMKVDRRFHCFGCQADGDGTTLSIDCIAIEDEYGNTPAQRAELDWLLYNNPLEYARMVLSGEIEHYLTLGCDHGKLKD